MTKQIANDTAAAKSGVTPPDILVDVYGNRPPRAAEFGKGISDQAGAQEAQNARRNATPGQYGTK